MRIGCRTEWANGRDLGPHLPGVIDPSQDGDAGCLPLVVKDLDRHQSVVCPGEGESLKRSEAFSMGHLESTLKQLELAGKRESQGSFTVDLRAALEKMGGRRVTDPAFPFWKFLQACVVAGAVTVQIKIGRRSATAEAMSYKEFPSLESFCNSLPGRDLALEPLQSAALALASDHRDHTIWARESRSFESASLAVLSEGSYQVVHGEAAYAAIPPRTKSQIEKHRLYLRHEWGAEGNFFLRQWTYRKHRVALAAGLQQRTRFYPVMLDLDGRVPQEPILEPLTLAKKVREHPGSQLDFAAGMNIRGMNVPTSDKPLILRHTVCDRGGPHRFLSEPLGRHYATILEIRQGQQRASDYVASRSGFHVPLLVLDNDESGDEFSFPPPHEAFAASLPLFSGSLQAENWVSLANFRGRPCFVSESIFIPQYAKTKPGEVWIIDRGVVIGSCEIDLGVPGAVVLTQRGALRVDLGGGEVVKDEVWDARIQEIRQKLIHTLELGRRYIENGGSLC